MSICVHLWLIIFCFPTLAQTLASGAPGKDAQWATAGKQAIGTSASLESKIWFTLAEGVMTEVYYPDVTTANVHLLQFIVVNPKTRRVETERDDANHEIKVLRPDSLTFQQTNSAKSGEWKITKTYTTDIERDSVLINVQLQTKNKNLNLYVYYDPSLGNRGMGDYASFKFATDDPKGFFTTEKAKPSVSSVIAFSSEISEQTNGFYQISDGLEQLKQNGKIVNRYDKASNGNVVQMAKISSPLRFTTVLSFAENSPKAWANSRMSLNKSFAKCLAEYEKGWADYVKTLPRVAPKYQAQFNMAAMVLKAQEDKTVRGANVASLTIPWGGGKNANEDVGGGYHLVWSRDLYEVVTAYMALGDTAAANRALDFLFNVQQKPDGSFPQNSWLDGKKGWGSLQLDEVAYPLILAYQLKRFDKQIYENHVKKAADFLVKTGPKTPQERWEEKSGYSPSTIAAEIAGLVCAAEIAKRNDDETSANLYLKTADDWQANIEKWTATKTGKYGDGNYYIRLTENGKPDAGEKIVLNNGAGTFDEREIVDAGFLELVRLGIKSPDDPLIQKSLKVVDQILKVNTPNGEAFYRYNHDGYGEMDDGRRWNFDGKYIGKGRLWALLAGERGEYELAVASLNETKIEIDSKGNTNATQKDFDKLAANTFYLKKAEQRLNSMLGFANEGLMIPEQIWDKSEVPKTIDKEFIPELKFGEGTGSATPLAWSMAQFIRLAVNLQAGRNLETPDVVYNRYIRKDSHRLAANSQQESTQSITADTNWDELKNLPKQSIDNFKVISFNPKIAKTSVTFIYSGEGKDIEIVGDFTGWQPKGLKFVNGKITLPFAPTARAEYKFIVDGKWITDPLNPNKIDNGVGGENSFFTMSDYKPTVWDKETNGSAKIDTLEIDSKIYGKRAIKVYQPLINSNEKLPTLYLQDGTDYINRARAIQIQQNLVKAGKIKPFIMVFVDYKDRLKEYWASDDYAKFLATEVVPAIDAKYNTIKSRDGRAILGASLGGVTSIHTALKYPEIFSKIGGQSSSFWIDNERVVKELETLDAAENKFRFYFDTGTLEGAGDDRKAVEILKNKGFDVSYEERETGHNWTAWRDRLADAFIALWNN
ncbi:MAG: glycoside hydrolase family 15 protein [Pyrinomonadaceae bacterium]